MHVIYDGRVMIEQYSGLGRFTGELLFALLDMDSEFDIKYSVIIWEDIDAEKENFYYQKLRQYESNGSCKIVSVPCRAISLKQHFYLAHFINHLDGDIYFYPHFDLPFGIRFPSVVVIHDLYPLKNYRYSTKNRWLKIAYFKLMLQVVARRAKFIFTVSETTRKDFLAEVGQRFSGKVDVSREGPMVRRPPNSPAILPSFTLPHQFLLYVGGRRPNKNLKRIIDLFILLKEKASYPGSLLLAGSTKNYDFDVERYIGKRADIQVLGQVDDNFLTRLYKEMDALLFLSKYEGFGLPVIETSLFRKKMILSDGGALPEIAPPWAFILPNDADLNRAVVQVSDYLKSPVMFDESYEQKYNWCVTAQRIRHKFIDLMDLHVAMNAKQDDIELNVIRDFGSEWSRFDQSSLSAADHAGIFKSYFNIFPWDRLPQGSIGADIGCGSGRWASLVASRVGHLHLVDPSGDALAVARKNLSNTANVSFYQTSADELPFEHGSLDFAYSLGVLHHVSDTMEAIHSIARALKPGAPFLIYLYYAFDQRPWWFRAIWKVSDTFRKLVSRMPVRLKNLVCEVIALFVYFPLARAALVFEWFGILPDSWPLAYYRNREYYVMRTDALDRFGTRLEKRFTREDIRGMLKSAGFTDIRFSEEQPFWCAVGIKKV